MYRLVVIDAEKNIVDCVERQLDRCVPGFALAAGFGNGEEAVAYLRATPVDAVLLAAELPGMTGMEVALFIHQNLPECGVVMMSERDDYALVKMAMHYGVCDFIHKPVEPEELKKSFEIVREKLERSPKRARRDAHRLPKNGTDSTRETVVMRAMRYIEQHILEDVSLEMVSGEIHVSTSHLIRLFRKETGYTYLEYVTRQKMEKAAQILVKGNVKVYEVSKMLGYCSTRHFSKLFFKRFGCYPSDYLKNAPHDGNTAQDNGVSGAE